MVNHISIEVLDGDMILSDNMLLSQTMLLRDEELTFYLIVFEISDFNMILGMDFFSRYRAKIDDKRRKFKFNLENGDEFFFGKGQLLSMMINSTKAHKMLSNVCIRSMTHMVNRSESVLSMRNTLVVCEFQDVFP